MIEVLLWIVAVYVFVVFVASRFVVPYLGFSKDPLPDKLPASLKREISRLKKHKSREAFVKGVYDVLSRKYYGRHLFVLFNLHLLFTRDISKVWAHSGYLPCTQICHLFRIFLVKSGLFSDEDVRLKTTVSCALIHQYLQVRLKGGWVSVDVWAKGLGRKFGEHAGV